MVAEVVDGCCCLLMATDDEQTLLTSPAADGKLRNPPLVESDQHGWWTWKNAAATRSHGRYEWKPSGDCYRSSQISCGSMFSFLSIEVVYRGNGGGLLVQLWHFRCWKSRSVGDQRWWWVLLLPEVAWSLNKSWSCNALDECSVGKSSLILVRTCWYIYL